MLGASSMAPATEPDADDLDRNANSASNSTAGDLASFGLTPEVLDGGDRRGDVEQRRLTVTASFSGPIPLPGLLKQYNDAIPGLGDEIAAQWKAEAEHRRETIDFIRQTDRLALEKYHEGESVGSRNALILGIGVLLIVALAIVMRSEAIGVAAMVTAIGGIIWAMRRDSSGPGEPRLTAGDLEDGEGEGEAETP